MNATEAVELLLKKRNHSLKGCVIGLIGTLGSGKTHLVKKLLKTLDSHFENQVQSPTYNICNVYNANNQNVHHFDLYRVELEEDLYELEIWESIDNSEILVFIEWVDQFPVMMGRCDILIFISVDKNNRREYEIKQN